MRQITKRLSHGQDLRQEIAKLAQENSVQAGCILSAVGCLSKLKIRLAGAEDCLEREDDFEIVSVTGTFEAGDQHVHIAVADKTGQAYGGHLKEGCVINTTVELVVLVFDDVKFRRVMDEATGYPELTIEN